MCPFLCPGTGSKFRAVYAHDNNVRLEIGTVCPNIAPSHYHRSSLGLHWTNEGERQNRASNYKTLNREAIATIVFCEGMSVSTSYLSPLPFTIKARDVRWWVLCGKVTGNFALDRRKISLWKRCRLLCNCFLSFYESLNPTCFLGFERDKLSFEFNRRVQWWNNFETHTESNLLLAEG